MFNSPSRRAVKNLLTIRGDGGGGADRVVGKYLMNKITELNEQIAYFTSLAVQTADEVVRAAIRDIIAEIEAEVVEASTRLAA